MVGTLDLSFETFQDLDNIPTAKGRGWLASELNRDDWTVTITDTAINEIVSMVDKMVAKPLPTLLRNPLQFDIPELASIYKKVKNICDHGAGFAVIANLPLDDFTIEQMVDVYWTLGQYMGKNVAQKWDGTMIYDVTDTGKKFGYGIRGPLPTLN